MFACFGSEAAIGLGGDPGSGKAHRRSVGFSHVFFSPKGMVYAVNVSKIIKHIPRHTRTFEPYTDAFCNVKSQKLL